jgi:putative toxin-antitoxin system antitoxin component (TIGR02293 family)
MDGKLRFATPGALASDTDTLQLEGFIRNFPFMAQATRVLGSEAAAVEWLQTPAIGLDQRRPIDVMLTDPQLVHDLLVRMDYGVYT